MKPERMEPAPLEGAVCADIAGVSLELLRLGQGRPLLFLHGMDGLEGSLNMIRELSKQFDVFAPSHPGFGASELPSSFDTIDDVAYLYLELVEKLKLTNAIVIGMSFGGWIAAEMLIKNQIGISQLVLGAPLGLRTSDRRKRDMQDIFMMPAREVQQLLQLTPYAEPDLASADENQMRRVMRGREAVSLYGWSPYLNDPKLAQRLHRIGVPTLVIWGLDDALIPVKYGAEYVRTLRNARLETIDHCGHRIYVDQPDKLGQLIGQFSSNCDTEEAAHARLAV